MSNTNRLRLRQPLSMILATLLLGSTAPVLAQSDAGNAGDQAPQTQSAPGNDESGPKPEAGNSADDSALADDDDTAKSSDETANSDDESEHSKHSTPPSEKLPSAKSDDYGADHYQSPDDHKIDQQHQSHQTDKARQKAQDKADLGE